MTVEGLVKAVVIVEAVAAVLVIAALFASGVRSKIAVRARARTREAVHRLVAARIAGGKPTMSDIGLVKSARRGDVIRAITDFAPTMGGADRAVLASVGRVADLTASADAWLTDRRWWRRLRAGRLLTLIGANEAQVRRLAQDRNVDVRAQGAEAASAWPFPGAPVLLVSMLSDPEEVCRFAAQQAVMRLGAPAIDAVLDELRSGSGARADVLLGVLATMPSPAMADVALRYSAASGAETRRAAARLLAAIGARETTDRLIAMLGDADVAVRRAVARALGMLGDWRAASALGDRLDDPASDVRIAAAGALQRLGAPGVLMLRKSLNKAGTPGSAIARQTLDVMDHLSTTAPA